MKEVGSLAEAVGSLAEGVGSYAEAVGGLNGGGVGDDEAVGSLGGERVSLDGIRLDASTAGILAGEQGHCIPIRRVLPDGGFRVRSASTCAPRQGAASPSGTPRLYSRARHRLSGEAALYCALLDDRCGWSSSQSRTSTGRRRARVGDDPASGAARSPVSGAAPCG